MPKPLPKGLISSQLANRPTLLLFPTPLLFPKTQMVFQISSPSSHSTNLITCKCPHRQISSPSTPSLPNLLLKRCLSLVSDRKFPSHLSVMPLSLSLSLSPSLPPLFRRPSLQSSSLSPNHINQDLQFWGSRNQSIFPIHGFFSHICAIKCEAAATRFLDGLMMLTMMIKQIPKTKVQGEEVTFRNCGSGGGWCYSCRWIFFSHSCNQEVYFPSSAKQKIILHLPSRQATYQGSEIGDWLFAGTRQAIDEVQVSSKSSIFA